MSKKLLRPARFAMACLAVCTGLCGCGDSTAPEPQPPATAAEESSTAKDESQWIVSMLNGSKIAHLRTALIELPDRDDAAAWREEADIHMSVDRFGETATPSVSYRGELNAQGELLSFECTTRFGKQPRQFIGTRKDGQLQIKEGNGRPTIIDCPAGCGGFLAVEFSLEQKPLEPGETRTIVRYDAVSETLATEELVAKSNEQTQLPSGTAELLRIEQSTHLASGNAITQVIWADGSGQIRKSVALNTGNEQYVVSKEQALAPAENPVDLAWATSVPLNRPLTNAHNTYRARYRVQLENSNPAQVFPQGSGQTVTPITEHTADLIVKAVRPMPLISGPRQSSESPPTAADVQPNAWIQCDDATIVNLAESVALDEVDSWKVAQALERLVHDRMRSHNFNTAMASAAEVAQSLEGDCTEHAVLLTALLRAREIPSRVAVGLVHTETLGGFGFHMWSEAYIHGTWIPLDATLGRGGTGAAHIRLSSTSLSGAEGLANLLPVAQVMGQLKIDVLEVE